MSLIDVFNGDADGLCALHQLRLADPADSELVTGPKRDISLLQRVNAGAGHRITVLDIGLSKNREALDRLEAGAQVRYFDHHQPGEMLAHPNFESHIDTRAHVCTSLLVNQLRGQYLAWAVTAAFGDNLAESAREAARPLSLSPDQLTQLQSLGECLNYNGYGENQLAVAAPAQAHAVLTAKLKVAMSYVVSVRAPKTTSSAPLKYAAVCHRWRAPRRSSIYHLSENELDRFMTIFYTTFKQSA